MDKFFKEPIISELKKPNTYNKDISYYNSVICHLSYFENISENDYITYHVNNRFEYKPVVYSFINSLYKADLVASNNEMKEFLNKYNCRADEKYTCYNIWVKEMNIIISDDELIEKTNLSFLRKAIATLISLEKIMPGSWGIDIENGNWLRILNQLKNILTNDVCQSNNFNLC